MLINLLKNKPVWIFIIENVRKFYHMLKSKIQFLCFFKLIVAWIFFNVVPSNVGHLFNHLLWSAFPSLYIWNQLYKLSALPGFEPSASKLQYKKWLVYQWTNSLLFIIFMNFIILASGCTLWKNCTLILCQLVKVNLQGLTEPFSN